MQFTDVFIRRPVFATVLSLIILLTGLKAFMDLSVRQYPEIAVSSINISTEFVGANADIIEGFITTPIEAALSGIDGIDVIASESINSQSNVSVKFKLGHNINQAVTDVSNAVAAVRYVLPHEVRDPIVQQKDPNAKPVMFIPFLSDQLSPEQVTDYLIRSVQPQIATVPGVAKSFIFGEKPYAMRIWLNPQQMAARQISASDVLNALSKNNLQTATGHIDSQWQEFNITATTDLKTPEEFNQLVVKNNIDHTPIKIKDIGYATLGPENDRVNVVINGKNAMILALQAQPTANPIDISKAVHRLLPKIQQFLPADLKGQIAYDASTFISQSIKEVYRTIIEATLCVILVIFVFLGSIRNALIPIATIPLSIIGVCSFMLALGYSINTLTLLACVLAIGLVVDDAIVVVENIHRHIEDGLNPFNAAIKGAREIGFAVIAMTFTLAAVYAPIGFLSGLTGSLFREFAFTLASAVIISGFVALTLSPMMCSKILKHADSGIGKLSLARKIDIIFNKIMYFYQQLLKKALAKKYLILFMAVIVYISCYFLYSSLPHELTPPEDKGYFLAVVTGPSNANLSYTSAQTQKIEKIYQKIPEAVRYGIINGYGSSDSVNSALSFVVLKPWEGRKRSTQEVINSTLPAFLSLPGIRAFPFNPPDLPGSGGNTPVEFVLKTTKSYAVLHQATQHLLAIIKQENPRLLNLDSDLKMDQAQIRIDFNRHKASDLGILMSDISTTLNLALAEPTVSRFNLSGRSYDVITKMLPEFILTPTQLGQLNIQTNTGSFVPLGAISTIKTTVQAVNLNHFQQLRSSVISANLAPGYTLGEALHYLETVAKKNLPEGIQYDFAGQSRQLIEASGDIASTFIFALIFIFLVLAAQFESFRDPLIVMVSVPLSSAGALLMLHFLPAGTLNIYTQIGLVTLIGLISKHGILIVEFANKLQQQGMNKEQAVIQATSIRLRPILMTTFAMILGALPLAFSTGPGAGARTQLGWVISGGMFFGTFLTLFIVPTVYVYLASVKSHEK